MLAYCRSRSSGWAWIFLIILCHSQPTWHVNSSRGKENTWKVEASKSGICESLARFFEQLNFAMCNSTQKNVWMRCFWNEVLLIFLNVRFAYGTHDLLIFQEHSNRRFAQGTYGLMRFPRMPPSCICTCNPRLNAFSNDTAILDLHMELTT